MALILDGTSPTGAWSMYRDLLTSFVGNTRYTVATGVNLLNDQSGNARNFDQTTPGSQPALTTAGPNGRACADLDGVDDYLRSTVFTLANLISAGSGYIVISFIADAITSSAGNIYDNNPVLADSGGFMGLYMKAPNLLASYNWDGTADSTTTTISTATLYVVEWRHDTGNLYIRINGGTETSVASGNTSTLTGTVYIGSSSSGLNPFGNIKVFELAAYSAVPALATRNAIVADFMAQQVAGGASAQTRVMVLA